MTDKDAFAGRRRTQEEDYFRKREQELIQKMRRRAEEEASRRRMAERTGVADEEILQDLQALGYTPETVMLLHVMPLVQVAWAEGSVSGRERDLIIEAARSRGIEDGSEADRQLAQWLTNRPSNEFFDKTLRAIGAMLQARPDEREASQRDLLAYCTAIASASGGSSGSVRSPTRSGSCWPASVTSWSAVTALPPDGCCRPPSVAHSHRFT